MCSGLKALLEFLRRQPYDTHALLSRALAGENLNTALGNIKNVGEQRDHRVVGFVVLWRRRDLEHERISTRPNDGIPPRPWLDPNREHYALRIFSQHS
jgi:hypothetical protein